MRVSFWFIIKLLILLICLCESAISPEIKKAYSGLLAGKGLYNDDDKIVILNSTSIKTVVYGTKNAWLVEFYNSWCGHCHKFAPIWKTLAAEMFGWRNVVQLAAIDCANDDNTATCRDYDIMAYPTVRFFSAHSFPSSLGTELKLSYSEADITRDIVGILQKEQLEGRGNHWPNLTPYRYYDTTNLWKNSDSVKYIFLIFADENDPLATEVVLDLSNVKDIELRGVVADNEALSRLLGVHSYPSLLVLEKSASEPRMLRPEGNNREAFRLAIKSFLRERGFTVPDEPKPVTVPSNDVPNLLELQNARDNIIKLNKIKELGDVVFLVDLENTVRYNLEHEISARRNISGEALKALKKYLVVLAKYFPMTESGAGYMQKLKETVSAEKAMKGSKFRTYLNNISAGGLDAVLTTKEEWIGCRGSESYFRGFPCGMWTLFHYLTVNALSDAHRESFNPLEVLEAMLGYVTHFFGCTHCSKHFQQMVKTRGMRTRVTNGEEAVLWLWAAHNEVNKRLMKDETEDPFFPKIQFPASEKCGTCREEEGNWENKQVLTYLKNVYGRDNLNQMGSSSKLSFPARVADDVKSHVKLDSFKDESLQKISKDFNIFDISLCVVLYALSAVFSVGVCLKFALRRRKGKKSHIQDLYGRV